MACSRDSKDSGYVDNWQTGKTVTECNLHMLTTEDCSDVIFRVGSEKHVVRAHRYVLVSRSCVFHAMFCGSLAEKGEIIIPDIDAPVFRDFLRYIYTDTVNITAVNVSGLLYTSRKYAMEVLLDRCINFLERSITEENVCEILEQNHGYGEMELEEKALKILTGGGEAIIRSPGFCELCPDCLMKFLESDKLRMREERVFEGALSWAKRKCQKGGNPVTSYDIRKYLGGMRYEIRFGNMPLDFIASVVGPSGVLTDDERIVIMDKIVGHHDDFSPFKSTKRTTVPSQHADEQYRTFTNMFKDFLNSQAWCETKQQVVNFVFLSGDICLTVFCFIFATVAVVGAMLLWEYGVQQLKHW